MASPFSWPVLVPCAPSVLRRRLTWALGFCKHTPYRFVRPHGNHTVPSIQTHCSHCRFASNPFCKAPNATEATWLAVLSPFLGSTWRIPSCSFGVPRCRGRLRIGRNGDVLIMSRRIPLPDSALLARLAVISGNGPLCRHTRKVPVCSGTH